MSGWDYVIVGAGSAGCVLASRLSEDPRVRVLLLEEGPEDDHWLIRMPKGNGRMLGRRQFTSIHKTTHQRDGGPEFWARGAVLGGSSSINGMVWVRGQPEDFDHWAALGNSGWSWADMAGCFKRLENHALGADESRGAGGPIQVKPHAGRSRLADAFIESAGELGLQRKPDLNVAQQEGVGYLSYNIDRRGKRSSAASGFLAPARRRPNLEIVTNFSAEKVLLENGKAVGVSGRRAGALVEYRTAGEVILSAGTIGSAKLLQLSGIGPGDHLKACGVPVALDSPGVGHNLREHWLLVLEHRLKHAQDSQNTTYSGLGLMGSVAQYVLFGAGPMSQGGYDAAAFIRSDPTLNRPDGQLMMAPWSRDQTGAFRAFPSMHVFTYLLRPESDGSILIESPDPAAPPKITPNYLTAEHDQVRSVALVRALRRVMRQPAIAALHDGETERTAGAQSDAQILEAFRKLGQAGHHACGACAMGQGPRAVVDERLRVRGLDRIRVADLSIFPELSSGNTNAPVMAVAMRAADLFIEDRKRA